MIEKESLNFRTHFLVIYDYYKAKFIHSHKKERAYFFLLWIFPKIFITKSRARQSSNVWQIFEEAS